jgi:signal transduction histidine kinase/streptogramin lyase
MYESQLPGELSRNTALEIREDKNGMLWIGFNGGGLVKFNPFTEKFTRFLHSPADKNSLSHNEVLAIHEDAEGYLWIGTRSGLNKLDLTTEKFTHYVAAASDQGNTFRITNIYQDSQGILWLATTSHGLMSFDKKGKFVKYHDKRPGSVINEKVNVVMKGSSGVLWLASERGGLYYFNTQTRSFHTVTHPASLSKMVINAIAEDKMGNLWLSTLRNGICKYSVRKKTLHFYDAHDGLQSKEFTGAFCQNTHGEISFGGTSGLNRFNPQCIHDNPYAPDVKITGFKVFDKPQKMENHTVVLPYSSNFFSFDFIALNFTQPEKNEYAYRLDGLDKEWIYTGTRKFASYTNLDPGEYIFRVKAANNDKVWSKEEAQIKVIITPPFWKTWWFRSGIVFSIVVITFAAYKVRIRSIQADNEKLESLVLQRTEEIKKQSFIIARQRDELQSKNSQLEEALCEAEAQQAEAIAQRKKAEEANKFKTELLGIAVHDLKNPIGCFMLYADLIKDANTDKAKVRKLADVIKNTSQYMFTLISDLLHTVRLDGGQVPLKKEKQNISLLVEEMVERNRIQAQWKQQQIEVQTKRYCLAMVDVGMLREVMENLISNAIKFTPRGKNIYIDVTKKEGYVQIRVEDEGIGLPEGEVHKLFGIFQKLSARPTEGETSTGLGLSIVKKLVELHNGRVRAESKGAGNGSIFIVELPAIVKSAKPSTDNRKEEKNVLIKRGL